MVRSVTPMISAASHHLRLPAMAFKITSCTFIIRSISADETICSALTPQGPIRVKRTDHVLIGPDRSHANNTTCSLYCFSRHSGVTFPEQARRSIGAHRWFARLLLQPPLVQEAYVYIN